MDRNRERLVAGGRTARLIGRLVGLLQLTFICPPHTRTQAGRARESPRCWPRFGPASWRLARAPPDLAARRRRCCIEPEIGAPVPVAGRLAGAGAGLARAGGRHGGRRTREQKTAAGGALAPRSSRRTKRKCLGGCLHSCARRRVAQSGARATKRRRRISAPIGAIRDLCSSASPRAAGCRPWRAGQVAPAAAHTNVDTKDD